MEILARVFGICTGIFIAISVLLADSESLVPTFVCLGIAAAFGIITSLVYEVVDLRHDLEYSRQRVKQYRERYDNIIKSLTEVRRNEKADSDSSDYGSDNFIGIYIEDDGRAHSVYRG